MDYDDELLEKHSVVISGHQTSVTLEKIFWLELKKIAKEEGKSIKSLITEIDEQRRTNLSSAIRVFILKRLKE
ncbi:ribbon-helix-helix domain-containing protein [Pseudemcibacter aquimaris]|uniref:ribbon-helix-helix domain-containing protein n=1 Tax=Pseudemcibacter aquimaris TaxID=2857064 RepID=UPI002012DCDB|nr:ribbon-helix-helix domain-containing protein [Pseudemcibacter aquimaris]MCC3861347.1 ribbon-helix-helix domain-containing protein [Pseudemcibacter aquimaris]WDU58119.1 ribbon-helix-helix domain-containing protein [Pseudemcibacter aquimaris]